MKSIRKKIKDDYPKSNILEEELSRVGYRVGFEKGANYVLGEIECILADKELDCEEICNELVALIEQLKK